MQDIVNFNDEEDISEQNTDVSAMTESLLNDVRSTDISDINSIALPIAQLSTLGAGISSLIPALNTATETLSLNTQGLYQLANAAVGDTLKVAKNGNFWGAFKTADGASKFAQLTEVNAVSATGKVAMKVNPATMMMAVALFTIEKELKNIEEMQKQILSFLEIEKEAEIEADVITLTDIINKYKHSWDNERFIASNHKMILDIQRTSRKNMISYQKLVEEVLKSKKLLVSSSKVNSTLADLLKKFKYYRLSLYIFSLSSLAEIMLSGNFKDENIQAAIDEVRKNTDEYRSLFCECSIYLEKLSNKSVNKYVLKGMGTAGNAMGKLMSNIPKVKDGVIDDILIVGCDQLKENADKVSEKVVEAFAEVSNPNTGGLLQRLEDINAIYNKTERICFDKYNLYFIEG